MRRQPDSVLESDEDTGEPAEDGEEEEEMQTAADVVTRTFHTHDYAAAAVLLFSRAGTVLRARHAGNIGA